MGNRLEGNHINTSRPNINHYQIYSAQPNVWRIKWGCRPVDLTDDIPDYRHRPSAAALREAWGLVVGSPSKREDEREMLIERPV